MTTASPTSSLPAPGTLGAWILAARPATLPVAVAPVAVGAACAVASGAAVDALAVVAALLGALWIQIGTNFANDVFDFEKGADDARRLGPARAVQQGLLTPRAMRVGMAVSFGAATAAGIYLVLVAGWPIVAIGLASIASGIAYTGGPFPLGYNGLGDLFVFVFFGLVAVAGTAFVGIGHVPPSAWLAAVPVGGLATAVLVVNNARDHVTDVDAGKRTLVVRFGRRFGTFEYVGLLVASYAAILAAVVLGQVSVWALAALGTLPLSVSLARRMARADGAALNPLLGGTARLLLLTSALLAVGIAFGPRSGS